MLFLDASRLQIFFVRKFSSTSHTAQSESLSRTQLNRQIWYTLSIYMHTMHSTIRFIFNYMPTKYEIYDRNRNSLNDSARPSFMYCEFMSPNYINYIPGSSSSSFSVHSSPSLRAIAIRVGLLVSLSARRTNNLPNILLSSQRNLYNRNHNINEMRVLLLLFMDDLSFTFLMIRCVIFT